MSRWSRKLAAAIALPTVLLGGPAHAQGWLHKPVLSGSMEPTLRLGSEVPVSVFAYLRSPPERGDVVMFVPPNEDHVYMLRVIGLPGDRVAYGEDKRLSLNGERVELEATEGRPPTDASDMQVFRERLPGARHEVLIDPSRRAADVAPALRREPACTVADAGFACTVPEHRYFLMGDSRDNARDSRQLGFIDATDIASRISSGDSPEDPARERVAGHAAAAR